MKLLSFSGHPFLKMSTVFSGAKYWGKNTQISSIDHQFSESLSFLTSFTFIKITLVFLHLKSVFLLVKKKHTCIATGLTPNLAAMAYRCLGARYGEAAKAFSNSALWKMLKRVRSRFFCSLEKKSCSCPLFSSSIGKENQRKRLGSLVNATFTYF